MRFLDSVLEDKHSSAIHPCMFSTCDLFARTNFCGGATRNPECIWLEKTSASVQAVLSRYPAKDEKVAVNLWANEPLPLSGTRKPDVP